MGLLLMRDTAKRIKSQENQDEHIKKFWNPFLSAQSGQYVEYFSNCRGQLFIVAGNKFCAERNLTWRAKQPHELLHIFPEYDFQWFKASFHAKPRNKEETCGWKRLKSWARKSVQDWLLIRFFFVFFWTHLIAGDKKKIPKDTRTLKKWLQITQIVR